MKFLAICLFLFVNLANACTGLWHLAADGTYVNGRTVEFGVKLPLHSLQVPRGHKFYGSLPNNKTGKTYVSKYAVVGSKVFDKPVIIDGINEKGLSAGAFYFSGYADYAEINKDNINKALAPTEFVNWILTQFASVAEVKDSLADVVIAATPDQAWHGVPPFHYVVYDKFGKSLVIEPLAGKLVTYDNPIGVMSNSPTFDWHLTNLVNYISLSTENVPQKEMNGLILKQFGQGNGLFGLPGDFTPPSRFVRAAIFSTSAVQAKDAEQAVFTVFHLLNQFDIPYGAVITEQKEIDYTQATTVKDPKNLKYYLKTYEDQTIKVTSITDVEQDLRLLANE